MSAASEDLNATLMRRSNISKMITCTGSSAVFYPWMSKHPPTERSVGITEAFGMISGEALGSYGCLTVVEQNTTPSVPDIIFAYSESATAPRWREQGIIAQFDCDEIVVMYSDLMIPRIAETSSLVEESPLETNVKEMELYDSSRSLALLTQQMRQPAPLLRSPHLLELAKRAVTAMSERRTEDVDEWARALAHNVKDAVD